MDYFQRFNSKKNYSVIIFQLLRILWMANLYSPLHINKICMHIICYSELKTHWHNFQIQIIFEFWINNKAIIWVHKIYIQVHNISSKIFSKDAYINTFIYKYFNNLFSIYIKSSTWMIDAYEYEWIWSIIEFLENPSSRCERKHLNNFTK